MVTHSRIETMLLPHIIPAVVLSPAVHCHPSTEIVECLKGCFRSNGGSKHTMVECLKGCFRSEEARSTQ